MKQNMINVTEYKNKKNQIVEKDDLVKTAVPSLIGHFKSKAMIVIVMIRKMIDLANHASQCRLSLKPMIFIASFKRFSFSTVSSWNEIISYLKFVSKILFN